jgi:aryl-alcohol dehydrogenase (NADP+)
MQYARIGASGLWASRICLGGNSWGAAGRRAWGAVDESGARAFFAAALDAGVNWFDTADVYNAGDSERIMGATLLKMAPRDDLVISTKVGIPMAPKPNRGGGGRKHLIASIDAQLMRLGTDYVDIWHIHRLDGVTPVEETLEAFTEVIRAGKARYLGLSTMPVWRAAQIAALAAAKGYARPIAMQNLYNLVQREEEVEMMPLCLEYGIGFMPYSPLARGLLTGTRSRQGGSTERAMNDAQAREKPPRDSDWAIVDRLVALAAAKGASPAQVALAWLLHKQVMAAPVIGVTRPEQITDAAKAVDVGLSAEEVAGLEEGYEWRAVK